MRHSTSGARGIGGLMLCLTLCACAGRPSSTTHVPTPTSPQPPLTPCVVQTPVSAPALAIPSLQTTVRVPGDPFASAATADGQWIFVSIDPVPPSTAPSGVAVLRREGPGAALLHMIPLANAPLGEALTHDGRFLIVADTDSVAVLDVAKAEVGQADALLGTVPTGATAGTIEVVLSPDDHFIFATDEGPGQVLVRGDMSVIDLQQALTRGFTPAVMVGHVPLDYAPVGMALAPDGRDLYATSELYVPGSSNAVPAGNPGQTGSLAVVDVQRAEQDPPHAVVARVLAGCHPVRVVLSPAGDVAWVTARESNAVLAFATARLVRDPTHALVATVSVGPAPVGMALVRQGAELLVACSNRFASTNAPQVVMLLNTQRALQGQAAVQASIPVGVFPREMTGDATTVLLTNYGSQSLSLIDTTKLPT